VKPGVYTKTIKRAFRYMEWNDFLARPLTLDDREFIQRICDRGYIENGSLSQQVGGWQNFAGDRRPAPDEEMDYWQNHWDEEPGVVRRLGVDTTVRLTPEQKERRRTSRIAVSEQRAEMQRIHAEEEAKLRAERERRILQTALADAEWERSETLTKAKRAAASVAKTAPPEPEPRRKRDYRKPAERKAAPMMVDAHNRYVPEWRVNGQTREWITEQTVVLGKLAKRLKNQKANIVLRRKQAEKQPEPPEPAAKPKPQSLHEMSLAMTDAQWAIIKQNVKHAILRVIRGSSYRYTIDDLVRETGARDRQLVMECANELAGGGFIGKNDGDYD